jgi:hypothetical protein
MKAFAIVLIASIVLAQFGVSLAVASQNSAAGDLASAKMFAFGGVGAAGIMSEGERNLRAVLDRPNASQQLQAAFPHATLAGELYILVGLRRCDRAAYQRIFASLTPSSDAVEVAHGCMISRATFRQLLSEVQDGRYDDQLSRPPR